MNDIEVIKQLKSEYEGKSLNEADTRFRIIDTIVVDVLKWPKSKMGLEVYLYGNKADYVFRNNAGKPIFVLESKKNSEYFELPTTANKSKWYEKITVDKLLTNKEIKEAISQVKEYAEDLLAPYAGICNGKVWIIFKVNSTIKPWKSLPAYVIKDLDYFVENYTQAINLLGYTSVVEGDSLGQSIGQSKKSYSELFYPKSNISAYDTPVTSNKYAGSLNSIARKYLGQIPETDAEFMRDCYVSNKGKYDQLQNDVQGFLHDSLTPYYKNLGFRDFTDDKRGGAFGYKIAEVIRKENLHNVMILFGGRGAGKSTFLKRFLFHTKPEEVLLYSHVALIGVLHSSQTKEELTKEIWDQLLEKIDLDYLRNGSREQLIDLFAEEFQVYSKQMLTGLVESSNDYQSLVRDFIQKHKNDVKLFTEKLSIKWKDKNKALIIFIDNMDQLPPELQDVCFLTAAEIAEKLGCLVIVSMREERYFDAKSRGVLDAYQSPGFHLSSPVIPEVLVRRIDYILDKLNYTPDLDMEFGIKGMAELTNLTAFFGICRNQLKINRSPLSYFLRYATHGDVRQALDFFKDFLTSGYTNIPEMAPHHDWVFQVHQVIKPMMIPDRFFYDERKSKIPNLYQLRNDTDSSHFTGLRLLSLLSNRVADKTTHGFIDAKYLIQIFETKYDAKQDCINHISLYLEKGIIESNNRLEKYSDSVDQIKITALGTYVFDFLAFNFAYLDLISLDSGIFDEQLHNYLVRTAKQELSFYYDRDFMSRIELRVERVEKFVDYLSKMEEQEFQDLNLDASELKFTDKIKKNMSKQVDRIIRSAKNKLLFENVYD